MNERETAVYSLIDILDGKGYNNIILRKTFSKNNQFSDIQKAFITEIVNGTLRNLILIDYIINQFSKTSTLKMKPLILNILRVSVYQIMFMNKVPHSAVCNEAVKIAKKKGFQNLSGFVNGVLRNIERNISNIKYPNKNKQKIQYLSIMYSYPEWIISYWMEELDYNTVEEICKSNNSAPKINICTNLIKTNKNNLMECLKKDNINVDDKCIIEDALYISKTSNIVLSQSYKKGLFHVMDESSMLAIKVLNPSENSTVIDICAAPGGKSFYCAYVMNNKGNIISRDIHEHKIELINEGIKRLGIDIIKTEVKDAAKKYNEDINLADYLIIDAPCSGLGLVKKKPDIKYSKTYEDIKELVKIQRNILDSSWEYIKPNGFLLYCTCTISHMENIDNIKWFTKNYPFELVDISQYLPQKLKKETSYKGYVQILSSEYEMDGFFIAKMRRKI